MTRPARHYRWLYAAVALCSLAVNLPWLGTISAWRDEAATRSASTRSIAQLGQLLHNTDAVLGVYYLTLHGWLTVFGDSWFSLRLPSALAFAVAAAFGTACGRVVGGSSVAVTTGVLMVLLPGLAWAGLDARPTAFAILLITAALWCWLKSPAVPRWPVFALVTLAGFVQLTSALQPVALINRRSVRSRRFWAAGAVSLVVLSPLIIAGRRQVAQVAWIQTPWPTQLSSALIGRTSESPRSANVLVATATATNLLLALSIACCVGYVALTVRTASVRRLLAWAYVTPLVAIGIGVCTGSSQYVARYFASSVPAIAVLVAIGICHVRSARWRIVITVLLAALCMPALVAQRAPDGKRGEDLAVTARIIQTSAHEIPVFYIDGAISVALAYPEQVAGRHQHPDPNTVAASGTLWGTALPAQQLLTALPGGPSMVVASTQQAVQVTTSIKTRCQTTRTIPGKRFTVLFVRCTR